MTTDGIHPTAPTDGTGEVEGLSEYTVDINGVETVLQLNDEDAKRLGVHGDSKAKAATPENKARGASNK